MYCASPKRNLHTVGWPHTLDYSTCTPACFDSRQQNLPCDLHNSPFDSNFEVTFEPLIIHLHRIYARQTQHDFSGKMLPDTCVYRPLCSLKERLSKNEVNESANNMFLLPRETNIFHASVQLTRRATYETGKSKPDDTVSHNFRCTNFNGFS